MEPRDASAEPGPAPGITVIFPFYNEEENLRHLAGQLDAFARTLPGVRIEALFVDDGSTDGSLDVLRKAAPSSFASRVISLSRNFGSHAAVRAGILHARSEYTTFMASDLQDPLELITAMHDACRQGWDIVWAERRASGSGIAGGAFSRLYALLMRAFVAPGFPENGFDIVMFNSKVRDELNRDIEPDASICLQILDLGFKQAHIAYDKRERRFGTSKWTLSRKIKLAIDSLAAFSYAPIRWISLAGAVLALAGAGWGLGLAVRSAALGLRVPAWPAAAAALVFGFGLTHLSLGILGEYLWRTLSAARRRRCFVVDKVTELRRP